jgi:uncharacterized protein involved in exopolysaccharide biosynthesis
MEVEKQNIGPIIKGDEIDLLALVKTIWAGRKTIFYAIGISMVLGLVIAFTSPKKYTASATLLPSVEKKGGGLGSLSALAGMAGINIGGLMGDASGIPAELYPQVVGSVPYLMELMHEKLTWEKYSEPLSLYEVIEQDTIESGFLKVKKYTIGLPWVLKDAVFGKENDDDLVPKAGGKNKEIGYYLLSLKERAAIAKLKNAINLSNDKKSGLISINVTMGEALLTAQLADKAVQLLQKHVIDYKTKQSAENLKFIQERFVESKVNYEQAQRAFFAYKDAHRNIVAERMDVEYQRLSDAYDIASAIYKGLAQQQEQAKITVKEETPVFKVLDPVVVPKDKSAPKRGMMLAVSMFLGVFLGIAVVFGRMVWENLRGGKDERELSTQ